LNEDVESLSHKDRIAFGNAVAKYFSPEIKARKEPPGSDINEVEITIIHKCIDDVED